MYTVFYAIRQKTITNKFRGNATYSKSFNFSVIILLDAVTHNLLCNMSSS